MAAIGRILLIIVVIAVVAVGAAFFLLPKTASNTQSFVVERPPESVFARIASTPANTVIAEGVTVTGIQSAANNIVVAEVAYADGATGLATYTVAPEGEGSRVELKLEQNLGANPLDRIQGLTGGAVPPLAEAAAAGATADLSALPESSFVGLAYEVVQLEAKPFFYIENCSSSEPDAITSIINQAVTAIPPLMRANRLEPAGPLMAVEPRVVSEQYCFQVGYPYTGAQPRALLTGKTGQTPAGTALRMTYTGTEEAVIADVYDRMDALLAAAHLDNPTTADDDWTTFEVYHDDPTQAGGSRSREIFYVATGDITALTNIAAPSTPAPLTAPAAQPAEAPAAPATEAPETPAPAPAQ